MSIDYWGWHSEDEPSRKKMDGKNKHPFAITCRKCGSNDVTVTAYEYYDLGIKCNSCGCSINCGSYHTTSGDYSDCRI